MASELLGRTECPIGCDDPVAHVKRKTDKTNGTAYPYVHCRGCGITMHTRTDEQARHLLRKTRPEKAAPTAPAAPPGDEQAPDDAEAPPAQKKAASGLFGGMFGG